MKKLTTDKCHKMSLHNCKVVSRINFFFQSSFAKKYCIRFLIAMCLKLTGMLDNKYYSLCNLLVDMLDRKHDDMVALLVLS